MQNLLKDISAKKTKQAFYHLFDFHAHSIASKDVLMEKRNSLSEEEKEIIKDINITNNTSAKDAEKQVISLNGVVENYYDLLVKRKQSIVENNEWSILSITDHNVFNFSSELSKISMDAVKLKANKLIILPGVELEVEFPFKEDTISCHILLLFKPTTDYEDVYYAIKSINNNWSYGEVLSVDSIEKFVWSIRHHDKTPGIALSAHINSTKGIRGEANKILTKLEARIAKLSTNEEDNLDEIETLKTKLPNRDEYEFDILNLIGKCGFDGLQVANQGDNYYFSKINKIDKKLGRSNPVLLSDAHRIEDIFLINNIEYPYIKLNELSSTVDSSVLFEDVRTSLRLGESRITLSPVEKSTFWIEGIRFKTGDDSPNDFWPYSTGDLECIIPFSRNLNCLIGGRGSGKSAIIESLCFMFDKADEYNDTSNREKDWYNRANKVLSNCSINTVSKYLDNENTTKKKALVHKRSFYSGSTNKDSEVYDLKNESLDLKKFNNLPSIDYYRFNEIEDYTKPERLRKLFDDICGREIEELNSQISLLEKSLKETKQEILNLAKEHNEILGEDSAIKEYVKNFIAYEKANKPEIKAKFEKLDNIEKAEDLISDLNAKIDKIDTSTFDSFEQSFSKFLQSLEEKKEKNSEVEFILDQLSKNIPNRTTSIEDEIFAISQALDNLHEVLDNSINKLNTDVEAKIESAKKELRDDNIDPDEDYRQNCKESYEESDAEFKEYLETTKNLLEKIEERKKLYLELKELSTKRSEIRENTANNITLALEGHLDGRVIVIKANANSQTDTRALRSWLETNLFPSGTQHKNTRINTLDKLTIDNCIDSFFSEENFDSTLFTNQISHASAGRINQGDVENIKTNNVVFRLFKFSELENIKEDEKGIISNLPKEIKEGLKEINVSNLSKYLDLFTLSNNDKPAILLNDRPSETDTIRDIRNLSPGQRCSAILPIILINGEGPLIIDQPEDNLDNKLVREVIVNILSRIKLKRQIIIATHNPNLPVLGDSENVIALQAKGEGQCEFISMGSIDDKQTVTSVTEIMEGGREAFQYRSSLYEEHWQEGAEK